MPHQTTRMGRITDYEKTQQEKLRQTLLEGAALGTIELTAEEIEDGLLLRNRSIGPFALAIRKWKQMSLEYRWVRPGIQGFQPWQGEFYAGVGVERHEPTQYDLQEIFFAIGGGAIGHDPATGGIVFNRPTEGAAVFRGYGRRRAEERVSRAEQVAEAVARDLGWNGYDEETGSGQTSREFLQEKFTLQEVFPGPIDSDWFDLGSDSFNVPVYSKFIELASIVQEEEPSEGDLDGLRTFFWNNFYKYHDENDDIGLEDIRASMLDLISKASKDPALRDRMLRMMNVPKVFKTDAERAKAVDEHIATGGKSWGLTPTALTDEQVRAAKKVSDNAIFRSLFGVSMTENEVAQLDKARNEFENGAIVSRSSVSPRVYSMIVHEGMEAQTWTKERLDREWKAFTYQGFLAGKFDARALGTFSDKEASEKVRAFVEQHIAARPSDIVLTPRQIIELVGTHVFDMVREISRSTLRDEIGTAFDDAMNRARAEDPYGDNEDAFKALDRQRATAINRTLLARREHELEQDALRRQYEADQADRDAAFAQREESVDAFEPPPPMAPFERVPFTTEDIEATLGGIMGAAIQSHLAYYASEAAADLAEKDLKAATKLAKDRDTAFSAISARGGNVATRNLVELITANMEAGGGDMLNTHIAANDLITLFGNSPEAALSAFTGSFTEETAGYEELTGIISTQKMRAETPMLAALTESAKGVISKAQPEIDELQDTKAELLTQGTSPDDEQITSINARLAELGTIVFNAGAGISDIPMRPGYDIGGAGRLMVEGEDGIMRDVTEEFIFRAEATKEARRGQFTQEDYDELMRMVPEEDRGLAQEFFMSELAGFRQKYETGVVAGGDQQFERDMQNIAAALTVRDPEAARRIVTPEGDKPEDESVEEWRARVGGAIDPKETVPTELPPHPYPEVGEEPGTYRIDEHTTVTIPEGGRRPVPVVEEAPGEYSRRILGAQAMAGARSNLEQRQRASGQTFMQFARSGFPSALEEFRRTRAAKTVAFTGSKARRGRMAGGRRVRF